MITLRRPRSGRGRGASGCSTWEPASSSTIPGPVPDGDDGYVSPGHAKFDRVWALIAESGVPLALHAGLSGVGHYGSVLAGG